MTRLEMLWNQLIRAEHDVALLLVQVDRIQTDLVTLAEVVLVNIKSNVEKILTHKE
jgi:hypothetical protein